MTDNPEHDKRPDVKIDMHTEKASAQIGHADQVNVNYVPPPRGCPAPPNAPPNFTGRTAQLTDLRAALAAGEDAAITAVQGLGGVGKTALARKLAAEAAAQGFSTVFFTVVARKPNLATLLRGWASHAEPGFEFSSEDPAAEIGRIHGLLTDLVSAHCPGRALVVFDDVWPDGIEVVRQLREAAPHGAAFLVTTRWQAVANHLRCQRYPLAHLPIDQAEALLARLVTQPAVGPAQRSAVAAALKGHALALVLASGRLNRVAQLGAQAVEALIARYQEGLRAGSTFAELKLDEADAASKTDSLTLTLAESYEALDPVQQGQFRALGLLPLDVPFDLPLLAALWRLGADAAGEALLDLLDGALLAAAPDLGHADVGHTDVGHADVGHEAGQGWYAQHPLLRAYARALLKRQPDDEAALRYAAHVSALADTGFPDRKYEEWAAMTPYLPQVAAVGELLYDRAAAILGDLDALAGPQPPDTDEGGSRAAHTDEARPWLEVGSAFAAAVKGYVWFRRETGQAGLRWLVLGLACARVLEQREHEGLFTGALGSWYDQRGHMQEALAYMEQRLRICRERGDQQNEAATLNNMGKAYNDLGEKDEALVFLKQALALTKAVGDRAGQAATLNNMGKAYNDLGKKDEALALYKQTLEIDRAVGDRAGEATTLNNMGWVHASLGEKDEALALFKQALPLRRAVGDRAGEATTLTNMGRVYSDLGEKAKALALYEEALPIHRAVGDWAMEATTLNDMSFIYFQQGDSQRALEMLEQILPIRRAAGDRYGEARTLYNISHIVEGAEAIALVEQARDIWAAMGVPDVKDAEDRLAELRGGAS